MNTENFKMQQIIHLETSLVPKPYSCAQGV